MSQPQPATITISFQAKSQAELNTTLAGFCLPTGQVMEKHYLEQAAQLQTQISELQSQLTEANKRLDARTLTIKESSAREIVLIKERDQARKQVEELTLKNAELSKPRVVSESDAMNVTLRNEIDNLRREIQSQRSVIANVVEERDQLRAKQHEWNNNDEANKDLLDTLNTQADQINTQAVEIVRLNNEIKDREASIELLKATIAPARPIEDTFWLTNPQPNDNNAPAPMPAPMPTLVPDTKPLPIPTFSAVSELRIKNAVVVLKMSRDDLLNDARNAGCATETDYMNYIRKLKEANGL